MQHIQQLEGAVLLYLNYHSYSMLKFNYWQSIGLKILKIVTLPPQKKKTKTKKNKKQNKQTNKQTKKPGAFLVMTQ